ncbi:hypothetical protein BMS3Bbin01_00564 [bacterium BMS3Bbin01]|nr:hypothetical protein BMS3Bbin01_00564 [bacterium BMS3Bbin01]
MSGGELFHEHVLRAVGVLILVDHHVLPAPLIVLEHLGERAEQLDGDHQEIVEVHCGGLQQSLLVQAVDVCDLLVIEPGTLDLVGLEVDHLVLRVRDRRSHVSWREPFRIHVEVAYAHRDEPYGVGVVVDGEPGPIAEPMCLPAQDPGTCTVKRRDRHRPHTGSDQRLGPVAHLSRSLVGEGDRKNRLRGHAQVADQVSDPIGEHPRLARPGAGDDQYRTFGGRDRITLHRVQVVEQQRIGQGTLAHGIDGTRAVRQSGRLGSLAVLGLRGTRHRDEHCHKTARHS